MTKKVLILVLVLGFIIRIININFPPLLIDEASIGYNAYSILETAKDEYGQFLPIVFKSFGDYKPGLYIYLTTPFIAIFGLSTFSVRLPSVILGSLIPLILYLLILKIKPGAKNVALISAILIAFNPWNIHFSRGAWETNILLFELLLAIYFYFSQNLFFSSLIFSLTLYTYQGGKLITPLLIIILLLVNIKTIKIKKIFLNFLIPLFILGIPILYGLIFNNDSNRLKVFSLWAYKRTPSDIVQIINESNQLNYNIFHSEPLFLFRNFLIRYFNHFSPEFLIFQGDWQVARHSAPYVGVLLFPSVIFIIIGLFYSFSKPLTQISLFFFLWLLISPLPAALTKDSIQPVRSLNETIPLLYFAAIGISHLLNWLSRLGRWKLFGYCILIIVYLMSFIYYQEMYFNHMVKIKPQEWLYGYQQAMDYAIEYGKNKQVYFTDYYGQPYIYYLFYSKLDPSIYQPQAILKQSGPDVGRVEKINNFHFEVPNYSFFKNKPAVLLIFSQEEVVRQGINLNDLIPLSPINGSSTFYAYENN